MAFVVDIDIDGNDHHKMMARQDSDDENNEVDVDGDKAEEPRDDGEDFEESSSVSDAPGGLVGLISNLSGASITAFRSNNMAFPIFIINYYLLG